MTKAEAEVSDLKLKVGEHGVRLENGIKVFAAYNERITEIDKRTTPSPPSAMKIAGLTLAFFMAAAGALWGLATQLRDRPTTEQIERILDRQGEQHELVGHKDIKANITSIQGQLVEQKVLINTATTKLDTLLIRIPDAGPAARRRLNP